MNLLEPLFAKAIANHQKIPSVDSASYSIFTHLGNVLKKHKTLSSRLWKILVNLSRIYSITYNCKIVLSK